MSGTATSGRNRMIVEIPNTIISHLHKSERWSADDYAKLILLHNQGKTNKEIAHIMGRSVYAIDTRLYKIRHKFKSMRRLGGFNLKTTLASALKNGETGCKYHPDCDRCPFPACVFDGYDPEYEPPKRCKKEKRWTANDIQHWNELERLPEPLSDETLANIFRTTVPNIQAFKDARRSAEW